MKLSDDLREFRERSMFKNVEHRINNPSKLTNLIQKPKPLVMDHYFIANIRIKDEQEYQRYLNHSSEIFAKYNGKYLAIDNEPDVLEGDWSYSRAVLISFPSKEDFNAWYQSEEYQLILKHRLAASDCDTILIRGKS